MGTLASSPTKQGLSGPEMADVDKPLDCSSLAAADAGIINLLV